MSLRHRAPTAEAYKLNRGPLTKVEWVRLPPRGARVDAADERTSFGNLREAFFFFPLRPRQFPRGGQVSLPVSAEPYHMAVVEVLGLRKSYGKVEVLKGLNMNVEAGQVYGFLGRNGAGKSTTLKILVGILSQGAGSVRLFGEPMEGQQIHLRQQLGYVAQEQNFYGWMTPTSIGRFVSGFYPTWEQSTYDHLVKLMELPAKRQIQTFSGGMKAKQALALALAHRPELLVLDEPTAGLDPVARREFSELVREQAQQEGHTILFSSHLVDEVERSADRVGILERGVMHYEGPREELYTLVRRLRLPLEPEPAAGLEVEKKASEDRLPPGAPSLGQEFLVLQDRVRSDHRELVLQADDPASFEELGERFPEGTLEKMNLEDIFVEMVTRYRAQ